MASVVVLKNNQKNPPKQKITHPIEEIVSNGVSKCDSFICPQWIISKNQ